MATTNISAAMGKHYRSMFRKFKARVRAMDKEGLDLDIANTAIVRLEKLGIDPMQKKLSDADINKLSKGTVLETFLENKLSTARGRKKVIKIIASKAATKYKDLDKDMLSDYANFLTTTSYSLAVSLGILDSDIVADIYENMDDSLEDIHVAYAVDEMTKRYLNGDIKKGQVYQTIINVLDELANS